MSKADTHKVPALPYQLFPIMDGPMPLADAPRLVFLGTPMFASTCLQHLVKDGFNVVGVVAQPDRPAGRGHKMTSPPVAEYARQQGLPLIQPENFKTAAVIAALAAFKPDFLIVVAYGGILPPEILALPTRDILNVHASLLPRHRGAAPIQYALLEGDTETGVCVMRITQKLDAGPVFASARLPLSDQDTTLTLLEKLAHLGAQTLSDTLTRLLQDPGITPQPQNEALATLAPKIKKEMAPIDWQQANDRIDRQIRALVSWPVANTVYQEGILKVHAATPLPEPAKYAPGTIAHLAPAGLTVSTGKGNLLITHVQPEGKKIMPAFAWAQGAHVRVGDVFSH